MEDNEKQEIEQKKVSKFWREYKWEKYLYAITAGIFVAVAFFDLSNLGDNALIKGLLFAILFYLSEMRYRFFKDVRGN